MSNVGTDKVRIALEKARESTKDGNQVLIVAYLNTFSYVSELAQELKIKVALISEPGDAAIIICTPLDLPAGRGDNRAFYAQYKDILWLEPILSPRNKFSTGALR